MGVIRSLLAYVTRGWGTGSQRVATSTHNLSYLFVMLHPYLLYHFSVVRDAVAHVLKNIIYMPNFISFHWPRYLTFIAAEVL